MRHFDRVLSEALGGTLRGHELQGEIERLFKLWGREPDQDRQDLIADEIGNLKTDENKEEWDKYASELFERNVDNGKFRLAMKKKAERGDNLAIWILKHLINAGSSQPT